MRGKIPVIFGVLTTNSVDQAKERASSKGRELALSTLSVLDIVFDG
jgi:6,7-dimethyl-8-ribityllumazine synthase